MIVTVWRGETAITFNMFWDPGWKVFESLDEDGVAITPTQEEINEAVLKAESGMDESGQ